MFKVLNAAGQLIGYAVLGRGRAEDLERFANASGIRLAAGWPPFDVYAMPVGGEWPQAREVTLILPYPLPEDGPGPRGSRVVTWALVDL